MNMDRLVCRKFTETTIPVFKSFDCGKKSLHEQELSAWISNQKDDRDVRQAMNEENTDVWYYENKEGKIIGYASLAKMQWNLKFGDLDPIPVWVNVLPALAVASEFKGKPDADPSGKKNRYWAQMLRDIIGRARRRTTLAPILGLFVHPENDPAKACYKKFGFEDDPETEYSKYTDMYYSGMILDLRIETEYSIKHRDLWIPKKS